MLPRIQYPCLGITLGTGAGVVLMRSPKDMLLIEISFIDFPFIQLFSSAQEQPIINEFGKKSPHRPIGQAYFNWVHDQHSSWDENKIQQVFNQRIEAFCKDMQVCLQENFNIKIKSIMFGGGNSRFIDEDYLHRKLMNDIIVLSPASLTSKGVSSDIISLLGCTCLTNDIKTEYFPSIEEIMYMHDHDSTH